MSRAEQTPPAAARAELAQLYARGRGPVAFIDESFRVGEPGRTFYVMSAALFERDELSVRRDGLAQVTAGRIVHATDWFRAGQHQGLQQVLAWSADNVGWHYLTVEAPVPSGQSAAKARTACLETLLVMLADVKAHTIVLDTRGRTTLDAQDEAVAHELRRSGDIARHTTLRHIDDRHELLLGCADLVAWAARRRLANDDDRWWPALAPVTTLVEAGTRREINLGSP